MRRYQITLNGRTFDIQVMGDPRQEQVEVAVDGEVFAAEVKAVPGGGEGIPTSRPLAETRSEAAEAAPSAQPDRPTTLPPPSQVTAPLPGVIKSIAVRPGQQVAVGDSLLVIEAMKMDNVLRASRGGIVETIHTTEGHQVAHGEVLLEYRA